MIRVVWQAGPRTAIMTPDDIESVFKGNNVPFESKDIQHARQFVFPDGGKLCAYNSGKVVLQGKDSAFRKRAEELLGQPGVPPSSGDRSATTTDISHNQYSNRVFIVYGHDVEAREQLELLLRRVKLEPVVLQNCAWAR
jgi:hypothetical protein